MAGFEHSFFVCTREGAARAVKGMWAEYGVRPLLLGH